MMVGDSAYFYNMPLGAVMLYDMKTCTTQIIAQFPSERQFHFTKILKVSDDPSQLLLVEDDRGIYHDKPYRFHRLQGYPVDCLQGQGHIRILCKVRI